MRGLYAELHVAGEEGCEGCNVPRGPPGSENVAGSEIQDEQNADQRDQLVDGRHDLHPDTGADRMLLIVGEVLLIVLCTLRLASEDAVGQRAGDAVHGRSRQTARAFTGVGTGFLNENLHFLSYVIRNGRENQ